MSCLPPARFTILNLCLSVPCSLRSSCAGGLTVAQAGDIFCSSWTFAPSLHVAGLPYPQVTTVMSFLREAFLSMLAPGTHRQCAVPQLHCLSGQVILCLLLLTSVFCFPRWKVRSGWRLSLFAHYYLHISGTLDT